MCSRRARLQGTYDIYALRRIAERAGARALPSPLSLSGAGAYPSFLFLFPLDGMLANRRVTSASIIFTGTHDMALCK